MRESWTIPSDEEVEDFTKAYLAAQESYYEEQEGEEESYYEEQEGEDDD